MGVLTVSRLQWCHMRPSSYRWWRRHLPPPCRKLMRCCRREAAARGSQFKTETQSCGAFLVHYRVGLTRAHDVQHARHTTAALHAAQQQRRSLLRPRGRQPTRRTSTCVRRARPALQRCDRPWRRSPRRKAFSSRMSEGFKTTDGCGKSVRQPTTRKTQLTDPSNSVYGMIRLPQVAQHAQLHAPVVLCEDRARWIERLWVGGVAESHVEPGRGVGRREVGDLGTGGR